MRFKHYEVGEFFDETFGENGQPRATARTLVHNMFPQVFAASKIRPVSNYPNRLRDMLEFLAPDHVTEPRCVLLTPGTLNSAYFEHSFLAQQMGIELADALVPEEDDFMDEGPGPVRTNRPAPAPRSGAPKAQRDSQAIS